MNWDQVEGNWKQFTGAIREHWGRFTDNDVEMIAGKRDKLLGKVQERYGVMREEAESRLNEFLKELHSPPESRKIA
ncbi:MAG: CsbD family protein [Acidobacteria bacterium]|nr:CsbD family protein [Acidobacteriota bacterium]